MTTEQVLAAARQARAANRPLSAEEFQALREALDSSSVDDELRGTLRGLSNALTRQSDERLHAQIHEQTVQMIEERKRRVAARRDCWRSAPPAVRAAHHAVDISYRSGEPQLVVFARMLGEDTTNTRPPDSFMPEASPRTLGLGPG